MNAKDILIDIYKVIKDKDTECEKFGVEKRYANAYVVGRIYGMITGYFLQERITVDLNDEKRENNDEKKDS